MVPNFLQGGNIRQGMRYTTVRACFIKMGVQAMNRYSYMLWTGRNDSMRLFFASQLRIVIPIYDLTLCVQQWRVFYIRFVAIYLHAIKKMKMHIFVWKCRYFYIFQIYVHCSCHFVIASQTIKREKNEMCIVLVTPCHDCIWCVLRCDAAWMAQHHRWKLHLQLWT